MAPKVIPQIKKILYVTDLSKNARHAFAYAISMANRYGAGVTILHVLEDKQSYADLLVITELGSEKWQEIRKANEMKVMEMLKGRLQDFCGEASSELPECPFITDEVLVKIGDPVEEILKEAYEKNYDLVVMGAHGHGMIADAMIGSVSRRVLRRCKKPVLVVRLAAEQ
ncbi:MAG: universal stress protein [Deltaproteobacteria bacterium]|nr:universal stress protein [Deltaproteobacteria bacterium]